jgi:hypothetical protein
MILKNYHFNPFLGDPDDQKNAAGFAPTFTSKPKITPLANGTKIEMLCQCRSKPQPEVSWFKGIHEIYVTPSAEHAAKKIKKDETLTEVIERYSFSCTAIEESADEKKDSFEIRLVITNPRKFDSDVFKCVLKNEFGDACANLNLNIDDEEEEMAELAPIFLEKPKIEEVSEVVTMRCHVTTKCTTEKLQVVWTKDSNVVVDKENLKLNIQEVKAGEFIITLVLNKPGIDDAGLYKCNIRNTYGELNANLTLNIDVVPVIKERPRIKKIIKKKEVIIECRVAVTIGEANLPKCEWTHNGTKISKTSSRHVSSVQETTQTIISSGTKEFISQLLIKNVTKEDIGKYQMVAKNVKGEAFSQEVNLTNVEQEEEEEEAPPQKKKKVNWL